MQPYEKIINGKEERRQKEMKKVYKRLLSVLLALVMVVGMIPFSAVDVKADLTNTQIYMDNTYANWGTAYAYFYSSSGNSGLIEMTKVTTETVNGFVVNIPGGYSTSSNIIFSENTSWTRQTQNISMNGNNAFRVSAGTGKNLSATGYTYQERTVYFENTGNWSEVYAYAWNSSADHSSKIKMTTVTLGGKTYYKVVFTKSFANIKFANNANVNGGTVDLQLPDVAAGSYIVFDKNGNTYTIDADGNVIGKQETPVDVVKDQNGNAMYTVPVTFYDYRTDLEIDWDTLDGDQAQKLHANDYYDGGSDLGDLTCTDYWNGAHGTAYNHYAFDKRFNYAISQYAAENMTGNKTYHMLYFGDFWAMENEKNGEKIGRYKFFECFYNRAYPTETDGNKVGYKAYSAAKQGLVDSTLNANGNIQQNGVELPYFNEEFLSQKPLDFISDYTDTGKTQTIGAVYENVGFPFRTTIVNGVEYYEFDSAKRDNGYADVYYLDTAKVGTSENPVTYKNTNDESEMVLDAKQIMGGGNSAGVGFFPFNNTSSANTDRTLNFGFGMKMEIPFTMTSTGQIKSTNGNMEDIIFEFTGDDDVWVFIDDQLVLDLGGDHAQAKGTINFADKEATVCYVVNPNKSNYNIWRNSDTLTTAKDKTYDFSSVIDFSDPTQTHTLTMFYMERGMIESNLKIRMNFPQTNILNVVNKVDTSDVDDIFINQLDASYFDSEFSFSLKDNTTGLNSSKTYEYYTYENGDKKEKKATITPNSTGALLFGLSNGDKVQFNSDSALGNPVPFETSDVLELYEVADQGKYNTSYVLKDADNYTFASGTAKNITNTEKVYAEATSGGENKFVFANDDTDKSANSTKITAEYTNKVMVEPVVIEKIVSGKANDNTAYKFTIEFSNVFGNGKTVTDTFTLKNGESKVYAGVPVGTTYTITEQIADDASYQLKSVTRTVGDDAKVVTNKTSKMAGADILLRTAENTMKGDTYQYINSYVTPQEYYAWQGHAQTLPIVDNNTVIGTGGKWSELVEKGIKSVTVKFYDSEGNVFTNPPSGVVVNEYNGTNTPSITYTGSKTGIDEFYITVSVTLNDADKTVYTTDETPITVNVYNVDNDIYVLDYGLKVDLNDTTKGCGFLQNDVLTLATEDGTDALLKAFSNKKGDEGTFTYPSTETEETYPLTITTDIEKTNQKLTSGTLTYEPASFMDGKDTLDYAVRIKKSSAQTAITDDIAATNGVDMNATITTMPASVVYYEDNFNSNSTGDSSAKIIYSGITKATNNTQVDLTQSNDQSEQYGYDNAYASGTGDSAGSFTQMSGEATATFTFKGTGFDIISRTSKTTASILVNVYKGSVASGDPYRTIPLITYYDDGDLYQVPVIHEEGYDYGEYTVSITVMNFDNQGNVYFYLDGIRIYNPLDSDAYSDDMEEGYLGYEYMEPKDQEIRPLILNTTADENEGADHAVICSYQPVSGGQVAMGNTYVEILEGASSDIANTSPSTSDLDKYWKWGPNNELYLEKGNAVAFLIPCDVYNSDSYYDADTGTDYRTLQVAAKLEYGTSVALCAIDLNGNTYPVTTVVAGEHKNATINSASTMYYHVPVNDAMKVTIKDVDYYQIVIANTSDGARVSLTNIKCSVDPNTFVVPTVVAKGKIANAVASAFATKEGTVNSVKFTGTVLKGKTASIQVYTSVDDVDSINIVDSEGNLLDLEWSKSTKTMNDGSKMNLWTAKLTAPSVKGKYTYTVSGQVGEKETFDIGEAVLTVK